MLVVYPPSARHVETIAPSYYEDHLLERVSLLELRLVQMSESLAMALDIIREQAQLVKDEHQMVKRLYRSLETLDETGKIEVKKDWDQILTRAKKPGPAKNKTRITDEILSAGDSRNSHIFERLVRDGFGFLAQKEEKKAFDALGRAAEQAPKNVPLLIFFAEQLFYADKFDQAREKLEKAVTIAPENARIALLLGAIYADGAEFEKAKLMLKALAENPAFAFCIDYIFGMTDAFQEDWHGAFRHFNACLAAAPAPEIEYLTGCALYQLNDYERALTHLQTAVETDAHFADAYFMQSFIFAVRDEKEKAQTAVKQAFAAGEAGAQCLEFFKGRESPESSRALPFQTFRKNQKRLLTGGSLRLRKYVRSLIFDVLNSAGEDIS